MEYKDESLASGSGGSGISFKGVDRPLQRLGIPDRKRTRQKFTAQAIVCSTNKQKHLVNLQLFQPRKICEYS